MPAGLRRQTRRQKSWYISRRQDAGIQEKTFEDSVPGKRVPEGLFPGRSGSLKVFPGSSFWEMGTSGIEPSSDFHNVKYETAVLRVVIVETTEGAAVFFSF